MKQRNWPEKQFRELIENHAITTMHILPSILEPGWVVIGVSTASAEGALTLTRGEQRRFKTLDAAAAVIREMGWRKAVDLHLD